MSDRRAAVMPPPFLQDCPRGGAATLFAGAVRFCGDVA